MEEYFVKLKSNWLPFLAWFIFGFLLATSLGTWFAQHQYNKYSAQIASYQEQITNLNTEISDKTDEIVRVQKEQKQRADYLQEKIDNIDTISSKMDDIVKKNSTNVDNALSISNDLRQVYITQKQTISDLQEEI
jgi:predicted  nucleic acid-binding Zn-ribbon protein